MSAALQSDQILRIESLGDNCELGFVLRKLGCEAGSLFRWARITPEQLLAVLRADFDGIYELSELTPLRRDMVHDGRYGIGWHTEMRSNYADGRWTFVADDAPRRQIYLKEIRKIRYLIAKLTARLKLGGLVFAIKCNDGLTDETIAALIKALAQLAGGAKFAVLAMSAADDPALIGTVVQQRPEWLRGYVSRFAPYDHADDVDYAAWNKVLARTLELFPCADWSERLAKVTIPETKVELDFPLDKTFDFSKPIPGDLRAGAAILLNANPWCRRVSDAFRIHGADPSQAGTVLRWMGVHAPGGASQLCAMLQCPVDDSTRVDVAAVVRDDYGKVLATWRGSVAPKGPAELCLDFVSSEQRPITIEITVHASRPLLTGERAVIDVLRPTLFPVPAMPIAKKPEKLLMAVHA